MAVDNEIGTLVSLIAAAIQASALTSEKAKDVGTHYRETIEAGISAATTLAALHLSNVKRIADAQEIIARDLLDRQSLFK